MAHGARSYTILYPFCSRSSSPSSFSGAHLFPPKGRDKRPTIKNEIKRRKEIENARYSSARGFRNSITCEPYIDTPGKRRPRGLRCYCSFISVVVPLLRVYGLFFCNFNVFNLNSPRTHTSFEIAVIWNSYYSHRIYYYSHYNMRVSISFNWTQLFGRFTTGPVISGYKNNCSHPKF